VRPRSVAVTGTTASHEQQRRQRVEHAADRRGVAADAVCYLAHARIAARQRAEHREVQARLGELLKEQQPRLFAQHAVAREGGAEDVLGQGCAGIEL